MCGNDALSSLLSLRPSLSRIPHDISHLSYYLSLTQVSHTLPSGDIAVVVNGNVVRTCAGAATDDALFGGIYLLETGTSVADVGVIAASFVPTPVPTTQDTTSVPKSVPSLLPSAAPTELPVPAPTELVPTPVPSSVPSTTTPIFEVVSSGNCSDVGGSPIRR